MRGKVTIPDMIRQSRSGCKLADRDSSKNSGYKLADHDSSKNSGYKLADIKNLSLKAELSYHNSAADAEIRSRNSL